jgi:hypothetical protein
VLGFAMLLASAIGGLLWDYLGLLTPLAQVQSLDCFAC